MNWVLTLLMPFLVTAQDLSQAKVYDLKSERKKQLYTLQVQVTPKDDGTRTEAVYKDMDGREAVREEGVIQGAQLVSYQITQKQTQEKGRIFVEGDKIKFEYEGPQGKRKSAEEKLKNPTLCTANFNAFVRENWDELAAGKAIDVRFAVWDRLETVGFTLQGIGVQEHNGERWIELRMKPSSFLIAALVDPIHLWYGENDKNLMLMKGRIAPKLRQGKKWRDLDAEVVYSYATKVETGKSVSK